MIEWLRPLRISKKRENATKTLRNQDSQRDDNLVFKHSDFLSLVATSTGSTKAHQPRLSASLGGEKALFGGGS
jgi:hypothetical protein